MKIVKVCSSGRLHLVRQDQVQDVWFTCLCCKTTPVVPSKKTEKRLKKRREAA